jgi:hypothetical protein
MREIATDDQDTHIRGSTAASPVSDATPDDPGSAARARRRQVLGIAAVASLANGIALLCTILFALPLPLLLVAAWTIGISALAAIVAVSAPAARTGLTAFLVVGLGAGIAATLAYDLSKAILSQLDPSPFNPFETMKVFGRLLLGESASTDAIQVAGWIFHLANGWTFAIAYTLLVARAGGVSRRRGILTGIAWGLFLEVFQLSLYPGWLNIRFLDEFRQISFLGHVVFGAVLGILVPVGLQWAGHRARSATGGRP